MNMSVICSCICLYEDIEPFVGDVGGDGCDGGQRDGVRFQ